jgi:two-component system response regulator HydG
MAKPTTLLVTSDPSLTETVRGVVASIDGFNLEVVEGCEQACLELGRDDILVVLYHLNESRSAAGVTRLLQTIAIKRSSVVTLVLSEAHRADQALALLRLGAADYLSRPLDLNRLAYLIDLFTLSARHGRQCPSHSPAEAPELIKSAGLDGHFLYNESSKMGRMIDQVRRIAPLDTTILLGGETGTGKTCLAGIIHQISPRCDRPLLVINCGALSASLIESEMFGHARGAFTGADVERVGKFAEVGRGTLFLDEIDSLPLPLQAKLLRVVENRVFEPVGSNRSQPLHARLIVASNRPLEKEVAAGRFRADLFYRLNVIAFEIPTLRERADIIPAVAHDFMVEFAARNGRSSLSGIAPEALTALQGHSWPGNVRELRNVIERAVALCEGPVIRRDDLPESFHPRTAAGASPSVGLPDGAGPIANPTTLSTSKARAESGLIAEVLKRNRGNRLRAAAELGISRMTLYNKINKYGLVVSP